MSVLGSMTRAVIGVAIEGQTERIRPCLSKVSEPQSAEGIAPEVGESAAPSGPGRL